MTKPFYIQISFKYINPVYESDFMKIEVMVPDGLDVKLENCRLVVNGPKGALSQFFKHPKIEMKMDDNKIGISYDLERKKVKAIAGTWEALIKNMLNGVSYGYKCEMRLVYSHFPVKMKVEDGKFVIENFLGERDRRVVDLPEDVKVEINKNDVFVSGIGKERVGQVAALIEQATRVKGYDRRVFQDGIYITKKPYLMKSEK